MKLTMDRTALETRLRIIQGDPKGEDHKKDCIEEPTVDRRRITQECALTSTTPWAKIKGKIKELDGASTGG